MPRLSQQRPASKESCGRHRWAHPRAGFSPLGDLVHVALLECALICRLVLQARVVPVKKQNTGSEQPTMTPGVQGASMISNEMMQIHRD